MAAGVDELYRVRGGLMKQLKGVFIVPIEAYNEWTPVTHAALVHGTPIWWSYKCGRGSDGRKWSI